MRILVTGHDGYIGTVLTPLLVEAGHEVFGLDTYLYADGTFGNQPPAIQALRKDLRDVTETDVEGIDAVVHLAAISNDPVGNLDHEVTYDINHRASVHLAQVAKAAGVSLFAFSSSCSLYGAASTDDVLDESAAFNPVTPYGHSKVLAERDVSELADKSFSPVFLRNATAYGVSPRLRSDLVVNNLTGYAVTTGRVLIKSDGTPWRPLVHVEDIARAFIAVLEAPRDAIHNEAFNVGRTDENYQIRDVADMVAEAVPGSHITYAENAAADLRNYRVDFRKISEQLPQFRSHWTVRDGVRQLADSYGQKRLTVDEFTSPRFSRLATITDLQSAGVLDTDLRQVNVPLST